MKSAVLQPAKGSEVLYIFILGQLLRCLHMQNLKLDSQDLCTLLYIT